nr:hypothetical protein [Proteus mirabilis]
MFLIDLLTLSHPFQEKTWSDIKVVDDCGFLLFIIDSTSRRLDPSCDFNLAIGLAAKVVPLDNANKEIANKYF